MMYSILDAKGRWALAALLVGGLALTLAGCAGTAPTPPAAKPAAPAAIQPAAAAPKAEAPAAPAAPTEQVTTAAAAEPAKAELPAPAVEAKEPEATVTIKAVDQTTGKVVELTFETVYFDYDKYNIKPEFVPVIKHDAAMLQEAPNLHVIIEGHCDERGTTEYNLALGQRWAVAVYDGLAAETVAKNRMKTISYGKEKPIDPGHDEQAWAKNRRGVFTKE